MFNSFPQPIPDSSGGLPSLLDWSAYQTIYDISGTDLAITASSWLSVIDVAGKGFFKWCRASSSGTPAIGNPNIRLTVDGQSYVFNGTAGGLIQGNEINFHIRFKTSLKIEVFNSTGSSGTITCDYLYLIQQSTSNPNKNTLLLQSQRNMGYVATASTTLTDIINVTGSGYLLVAKFFAYYVSSASSVNGSIIVDGVTKMNNRNLYDLGGPNIKQPDYSGPIRFNTSLRVQIRSVGAGTTAVGFAEYSLD